MQIIEPSNAEQMNWPDATVQFVLALEADNDRLRSALQEIVDASNSDVASGGEMFWAEAVGPAVYKAACLLAGQPKI